MERHRKTYSAIVSELKPCEVYHRLLDFGLFSEKLPPVFTGRLFLHYCKEHPGPFSEPPSKMATYHSVRNIGAIREISLPTPMAHEALARAIAKHWPALCNHFYATTHNQKYIVSRVHVRKLQTHNSLFAMNYHNWKTDGLPEPDLAIGKRFIVTADISKCFPNIYLPSLAWAVLGKESQLKSWPEEIIHFAAFQNSNSLLSLPTGPHSSNLLSEIVLTKIDQSLCARWDYTRHIDDYHCYVKTCAEARLFLSELSHLLEEYNLQLNRSKLSIRELPAALIEPWPRQLQNLAVRFSGRKDFITYSELRVFLDLAIELMLANSGNAATIVYALKILQGLPLSRIARLELYRTVMMLALIYPYLVSVLDAYLFTPFPPKNPASLRRYVNMLYDHYLAEKSWEATAYALFYATKYDVKLTNFQVDDILASEDCILLLLAAIYARHHHLQNPLTRLRIHASWLKDSGLMEEYWPFIFEMLNARSLEGSWRTLKSACVSFLQHEYRNPS